MELSPGNKSVLSAAIVTVALLSVPLVAMQFTDEVAWGLEDFAVGGALLFAAGLAITFALRHGRSAQYKIATGIAVLAAFLVVWVNLAVGIIGAEGNPANLMYFAVIAVGIIGACVVRFEPLGMARTMFAVAAGLVLVAVIALAAGAGSGGAAWPQDVVLGTGIFAALFVSSALLFRRSAGKQADAGQATGNR